MARRGLGTLLTLPTEFHSQPPLYCFLLHFLLPISSSAWFLRGISWFFCYLLILFVLCILQAMLGFAPSLYLGHQNH